MGVAVMNSKRAMAGVENEALAPTAAQVEQKMRHWTGSGFPRGDGESAGDNNGK
jgi:hypothetical protein